MKKIKLILILLVLAISSCVNTHGLQNNKYYIHHHQGGKMICANSKGLYR